jgi:hypothetical protein
MEIFETATAAIEAAVGALEQEIDPARRQAEFDAAMKPFKHEWKYAPKDEEAKAADRVRADQARRAGERLWHVAKLTIDHEPAIEAAIEASQEPLDALAAYHAWTGTLGATRQEQLGVLTLDELTTARHERTYEAATPRRVLADYLRAQRDPHSPTSAALIRHVERRQSAGWSWPVGTEHNDLETQAALALSRAIQEARKARIPEAGIKAREAIAKAKRLRLEAERVHGLSPRRPE